MSLFARWRIRRNGDGYAIRLPPPERALLQHLPEQLAATLAPLDAGTEIPVGLARLFPRAHTIDDDAESRHVDAHREDLLEARRSALAAIASTADAVNLTAEEADEWLCAINTLRLALGTQLGVSEEPPEILESDPSFADWVCYQYLSYLESELVDAMSGALPPETPGAGDDLPADPWGEPLGGLRWDGTPLPPPPSE